jgi:hypothetical protein
MNFLSHIDRRTLTVLGVFVLFAILAMSPALFKISAGGRENKENSARAKPFGDYDIRTDKGASNRISEIRGRAGKNAMDVAFVRDGFAVGERKLRGSVKNLKVEFNSDVKVPEVIAPDAKGGGREFLTPPGQERRPEKLKGFLRNNAGLTGVSAEQVSLLKQASDYKNPENDLAMTEFEQDIDGIPVFRGFVKAGFTKNHEIIRVINNLAPGLDYNSISRDFGDPQAAFHAAANHIDHAITESEDIERSSENNANAVRFGEDEWAPLAEKIYFPTEAGVAIPAWRILIWERESAYYVIVDAADGTMLWRKNITDEQSQSATYNVYANPSAMVNVAENPFPLTPGPTTLTGVQGNPITRTMVPRIGNEAPYTFNNNGWITDGGNTTDGNAVQAGLDHDTTNGVDVTNGVAVGNARVFDFPINPGVPVTSGNPAAGDSPLAAFDIDPGDVDISSNQFLEPGHGMPNGVIIRFSSTGTLPAPLNSSTDYFTVAASASSFGVSTTSGGAAIDITTQGTGTHTVRVPPTPCAPATVPMSNYQKAIVTQLFYISNWFHDETYRLGFTEASRNFQNDNFGRGGAGFDRVSAEAQDCSGTNNANFGTPADGNRGRMQMFLWVNPSPDFDGSLDADVVIHELTHGLSNRLHGNASGLSGLNMSRGMGEGWSDFYAQAMLSEPSDPINGVYPVVGYATYNLRGGANLFNNYYYGIRRFPKAVMSLTGPNGKPHNPMTFNDVDETKINLTDGAFAPAFNTTADGTHAQGEVWSSALWEIRAKYIARLGWLDGNRRILQHVTDGMKLAPISPTMLQERDAIISAAIANGTSQDVADIWAGFAIRGMGFSASIQNSGGSTADGSGTGQTRVTEAFDLPNLQQTPDITVSDTTGDGDGIIEPGEPVKVTVPLKNITGQTANSVNVQIVGGASTAYGSIAHNGTASNQINYTIPAAAACGSAVTLTINVTSSLGPTSFQRVIQIGSPVVTLSESFDGVSAPAMPAGWTATSVLGGLNFVTTSTNVNSAPNSLFVANSNSAAGGANLTLPVTPISTQAAILSFKNRYDTEMDWDGGVLEISIGGGPFTDIVAAGGSFIANGYNSVMTAASQTPDYTPNPLNGRNGWSGNSGGYITTTVRLPASAAGQNVQLRFRFGNDDNTAGVGPNSGWNIDNIQVFGQATCSFAANVKSRADFDGDGRTDVSVFRPSDNKWYLVQSTAGVNVVSWGAAGDQIAPGRYDNDNKTDFAVFRPSEGKWYILGSNGFTFTTIPWGVAGDKPVVGDYNGDGRYDPAVFRPSNNRWYVYGVATQDWGAAGDIPVPGDYNGDGKTDFGVFRPSTGQWFTATTTGIVGVATWGTNGDKPVPADYDGDDKDDLAVWRPSQGKWYIARIGTGVIDVISWGASGDIPVPGDYNGDGKDDPAVYRNGTWYELRSDNTILVQTWGVAGDVPIPAGYLSSQVLQP